MGKRKERRLAAKIAAGRRVKLDLLPEPPGDLGGSPANEAGSKVESKLDGSLPCSPSSSGEQPVNPLLLLGQYSDNELQDESEEGAQDLDGNSADDEQHKNVSDEEHKEVGTSNDNEVSDFKDDELGVNADIVSEVPLQVAERNVPAESNPENSAHVGSDLHGDVDVQSCWQMVANEESNSYYYWNTITGETSWEIPAELAQASSSSYDGQNNPLSEKVAVGLGDSVVHNVMEYANRVTQTSTGYDRGDNNQLIGSIGLPGGSLDNVTLNNYSSLISSNVPVGGWSSAAPVSNFYGPGSLSINQDGSSAFELPSRLLTHSESLLEKLKSLGRCESNSNQHHAWASKYISEIEIRLSDFKSLLSFGSILAPFWEHSERQLRRLEDAVNCEIGSYVESELRKLPLVEEVRKAEQEVKRSESVVDMDLEKTIESAKTKCDSLTDDKPLLEHVPPGNLEELSSDSIISSKQVSDSVQAKEQSAPEVTASKEVPNHEEVDMDVDMEVEDTHLPIENNTDASKEVPNHASPSELMKSYPADHQPSMSHAVSFPPPEEGEWVPPPPPDDEEIPPPPPNEPPPPLPPSYPESMPNISYAGNYTTYPDPNYSFYLPHESAFLAGQLMYYQAVPTSQAEAVSGPANLVGSAAYYGLPDGGLPTMSVGAQSSGYQVPAVASSYDPMSSEQFEAASGQSGIAYPNGDVSGSMIDIGAEAASSISSMVTAPGITNSSVSASAATAPATSAAGATSTACYAEVGAEAAVAAKPQPKVHKKKSVTVISSLRSNKKVSSMVDKWMAAKEELQASSNEEARSALELLENKRQREIEEWRAQQVASGEAKGNANFQPLGGDWRDRVKRRRAEKSAVTFSSKEETCSAKLEQQPDLSELSSGLPQGWQVYWDESSRQVYYGNTITSETTWIRPVQ